MKTAEKSPKRLALLGIILVASILCAVIVTGYKKTKGSGGYGMPILGKIPDFSLTERSGAPVTQADLHGKVWIADFIFTHCAGPCPRMSAHMQKLQSSLQDLDDVRLVSFSVDPDRDRPEVLTQYGARYGADPEKWLFLTGNKDEIYRLARQHFHLGVDEIAPAEREDPNQAIRHSTKFVLIDREGQIRAYYDSEEKIERLISDARGLISSF